MLNNFANKHGLRHSFEYQLGMSKEEFEKEIEKYIDPESLFMRSLSWSNGNLLYGYFGCKRFEVKKRRGFMEHPYCLAKANGSYEISSGKMIVKVEINGMRFRQTIFSILLILLYSIILVLALFGKLQNEETSWLMSIFMVLILVSAHVMASFIGLFIEQKRAHKQ